MSINTTILKKRLCMFYFKAKKTHEKESELFLSKHSSSLERIETTSGYIAFSFDAKTKDIQKITNWVFMTIPKDEFQLVHVRERSLSQPNHTNIVYYGEDLGIDVSTVVVM